MKNNLQIAIDGPVGSGKGTIAHILRGRLGGADVYTGGTYRAVALYCLQNGINVENASEVIGALDDIKIKVDNETIFLNGVDVTNEIRKSDIANATPKVALIREVRDAMIAVQRTAVKRELEQNKNIIVEGRDIGTNILPDAEFKVFLTADYKTRAIRRMEQLKKFGEHVDFDKVLNEVIERDRIDLERKNDPLEKDPESKGYFVIDNSGQSEEQTVEIILKELKARKFI